MRSYAPKTPVGLPKQLILLSVCVAFFCSHVHSSLRYTLVQYSCFDPNASCKNYTNFVACSGDMHAIGNPF